MGKTDPEWECTPLSVESLLEQGEELARHAAATLRYLDEVEASIP